jgi:signal transduction histidine kinase
VAVLMTVVLFASTLTDYDPPSILWQGIGSLASGALMIFAFRFPTQALVVCAIACGLAGWFAPAFFAIQLEFVLLLFIVAWRTSFPLALTAAVGVLGVFVLYLGKSTHYDVINTYDIIATPILLTSLAVGAGSQTRRLRIANERLVTLAAVDRRNAVVEERRRIARELHDVAAHHLTAVVVKSKIALRVDTPDDLREASNFAARSATDALASMRQLVGVLSDQNDELLLSPQPRLDELTSIARRMESAGLCVDMSDLTAIPPLSRQVELAVVRIVQESLTNVLRHRGPGNVWVKISHRAKVVDVIVEDDGAQDSGGVSPGSVDPMDGSSAALNSAIDAHPGGHGLVSMRERAAACGGQLRIDRSPRGGWRIGATFPVVVQGS